MAIGDYTIPNTTIYLLKGCPLDKDYRHTKYFTNATQQNDYFRTLVFKSFSEQTYQRYAKGQLRIAALADEIYSANYMMFQNTNHGNKWFYAFIDSVEYVSNTVTTVYYTIDVIQTWMFDYSMGGCFVEREHSLTDNFGENLVPENLETGDKIVYRREAIISNAKYMLGAVVLKKRPVNAHVSAILYSPALNYLEYFGPLGTQQNITDSVIEPFDSISQGSTVWVVHGLMINADDYVNYFKDNINSYDIFSYGAQIKHIDKLNADGYIVPTLTTFLNDIVTGQVKGDNGLSNIGEHDTVLGTDDIISVYTYPAYYALKTSLDRASNEGFSNYCGHITNATTRPVSFSYGGKTYIPKNKKTLISPYNDIKISNSMGDEINLKYELFGDTSNPDFDIYTVLYSSPCSTLVPHSYKGIIRNWDESISQSNYPVPAYTGNAYQDWLKDNRNAWTTGLIASSVTAGYTAIAKLATKDYIGTVSNAVNTGVGIANSLAKLEDLKQKSPTAVYQSLTQLLNIASNEMQWWLYKSQIKPEFAEIIDNYFSMFGYATKKVKIPNVKNPLKASLLRPSWNYIQTKGCMIHGASHIDDNGNEVIDSCVPADVERELERIYDNGITFWMPGKIVGDYTQDNSPVIT